MIHGPQVIDTPMHVFLQVVLIQACQHEGHTAEPPSGYDMALRVSPDDQTHIILNRPDTLLLLSSMRGGYARRGAYTGALACELTRADNKKDICEMHGNAVSKMREMRDEDQIPEMRSTLTKKLILPGRLNAGVSIAAWYLYLDRCIDYPCSQMLTNEPSQDDLAHPPLYSKIWQ